MTPSQIKISDFAYDLPDYRIAKYPLANRGDSKLLVYRQGALIDSTISALEDFLPRNAAVYFNQSKVVKARLAFQKPTGGKLEIFCLEPADVYADYTDAMQATGTAYWKCLVGGAAKWKEGLRLSLSLPADATTKQPALHMTAEKIAREGDVFQIAFHWDAASGLNFAACLERAGQLPIPPYLNRRSEAVDLNRYQTVFAQDEGSVAAPTAALHFSAAQLDALRQQGHPVSFLTLHVGAGTFKPVKSEEMAGHEMHAEWIEISREAVNRLKVQLEEGVPVVAIGTTVARTLESLYWIGCRLKAGHATSDAGALHLSQWTPYASDVTELPTPTAALTYVLQYLETEKLDKLVAKTSLIILPGYSFKILSALLSNFHQPKSTLLLLVSAWIGADWKKLYGYALAHDYRFLSYGDACLLLP